MLPTKDNLFIRGIIHHDSHLYVIGCGVTESTYHLFFGFSFFDTLWYFVRQWISFSSVDSFLVSDHFIQFGQSTNNSKLWRPFMQPVLFTVIWAIWKEINNRLFKDKEDSVHHILDKIKRISYWWLKAKNVTFTFGYRHQWSSPLLCSDDEFLLSFVLMFNFFFGLMFKFLLYH